MSKHKPIYAHCVYHVAIVPKTAARGLYAGIPRPLRGCVEAATGKIEGAKTRGPGLLTKKQGGKSCIQSGPIIDYRPNMIYKRINRICEENGFPLVGVHGLRHSFVSLAYHLNVPEKIVMEIGGWSDYGTMRKVYTHIARSDIARYTEYFDGFFSSDTEPTGDR